MLSLPTNYLSSAIRLEHDWSSLLCPLFIFKKAFCIFSLVGILGLVNKNWSLLAGEVTVDRFIPFK